MRLKCLLFSILLSGKAYTQMLDFNFMVPLNQPSSQWHYIELPEYVFGEIKSDFSDIRIFGITQNKDTFEIPYFLYNTYFFENLNTIKFQLLNQSKTKDGYYYTFKISEALSVNEIKLAFANKNFDCLVKVDGSHNQNEWFTFLENYRILSIENEQTNYQFTTLRFPEVDYNYIRVFIQTNTDLSFQSAELSKKELTTLELKPYDIKTWNTTINKVEKQSIIDINLGRTLPINYFKISASSNFDYYRPITIQYLSDSFKTPKGWQYTYSNVYSSVLSSIETPEFDFATTFAKHFRILIDNRDNMPLSISEVKAKGKNFKLLVRFDLKDANYYLAYGNKLASLPDYDLDQFPDKVPNTISTLQLKTPLAVNKIQPEIESPLIKNKIWLWVLMLVIIAILFWFTFSMLKKSKQ